MSFYILKKKMLVLKLGLFDLYFMLSYLLFRLNFRLMGEGVCSCG